MTSHGYKQFRGGGAVNQTEFKRKPSRDRNVFWTQYIHITADSPEPTYERVLPFLEATNNKNDTWRKQTLFSVFKYVYTSSQFKKAIASFYSLPELTHFSFTNAALAISNRYVGMHRLLRRPKAIPAIRILQRNWRCRWESGRYFVNTDDPITMEPIASLSPMERWSYRDTQGNAYAFHAPSLHHFVRTTGAWNPYTRLPFRPADLIDLAAKVHQAPATDFTVVWYNPKEAFLDVLYEYEKIGFYTLLDWFIQLTPMNIVHIYQYIAIDLFSPREFFCLDGLEAALIADPEQGAAMCYARDLKKLIESTHALKFYTICVMFVALATVCPLLRQSIPSWTYAAAGSQLAGATSATPQEATQATPVPEATQATPE
jgi:hypothetical protein